MRLYLLLHVGTFIAGYFDNGDMTAFALLAVFDISILLCKVHNRIKQSKRQKCRLQRISRPALMR